MSAFVQQLKECPPLTIYVFVVVISLAMTLFSTNNRLDNENRNEDKMPAFLTQLVSYALMTALYFWLCYNNHVTVAWWLLLLPLIFAVVVIFGFCKNC